MSRPALRLNVGSSGEDEKLDHPSGSSSPRQTLVQKEEPDTPSHDRRSGSSSPRHTSVRKEERDTQSHGCVIGGSYLEDTGIDSAYRPVQKVESDLPLTLTEVQRRDDRDYTVLRFAPNDRENPFKWPKARKGFITTLLNLMTLFIGLATTAYSSGIDNMTTDLHTSIELGQMGLFCFNMTCAIAPLFLAPFCELVGRKIVYVGAYACFTLCFIGLALGRNIATILVMRTLLGFFGCVGTILVGGTFSDMYDIGERAKPMAWFSYVAILGTVAAPIYAGFIDETIGWRWIEGIQGLANIPLLVLVALFLRETRGGVRLQKRARALRKETSDDRYVSPLDLESSSVKDMLHTSCVKAIHMLVTEPVVFAFGLWIGFCWFVVFLFLSAIPITFHEKRGWSEGVSGLPYISLCVGVTFGFAAHRLYQMRKYEKISSDPDKKVVPESRLYGAMIFSPLLPIGLFIYSFTQYAHVHWIAPTIALAPIAAGIYFVFESTYSYTADCYGESSSSAIAAQGFVRNTLGAVGPLFASQFFHNVGSQYAGLILSIVATVLSLIPFVFFKYGHVLRQRSKLARKF